MVFSSSLFIFYFLPLFLLAYYISPKKIKNYTALVFSLFFYAWGAPIFIYFLLGSCIVDFFLVKEMHKTNKRIYLWVSLLLNIGLLGYFKYANFFVENFNTISNLFDTGEIPWKSVVLPIGVSFFTFQKISYTLDVYRKKNLPQSNFWNYLLFITLFPQLIAGPIVRYGDIADQLETRNENINNRLDGMFRFIIGLAKKILIANVMAVQVQLIYSSGIDSISSANAWLAALSFTFQIYFDFSGYSDMAIGLGKMIGFKFPENFDFPYKARSITEFWQRWHMTLSTWMRDYLYIPLGGNRKSGTRTYINLFLVFLFSGLWHGAAWNFVIWGTFHGLFLVIERAFLKKWLDRIPKFISIAYCFLIVLIGWVFFSAETVDQGILILKKMFAFDIHLSELQMSHKFIFYFILAILFSFLPFGKTFEEKVNHFQDSFSMQNSVVIVVVSLLLLSLLIICSAEITANGFNPFLYYRF